MGAYPHINLRSPQIKDVTPDLEVTIEQRVEALETELGDARQTSQMQALVISQYQQALANANHQNAILTAQLKLATKPTE